MRVATDNEMRRKALGDFSLRMEVEPLRIVGREPRLQSVGWCWEIGFTVSELSIF